MTPPVRAFFSFSRVSDPTKHRAYGEWHALDHGPQNYALPGVIFGTRWVRTPDCKAVSPALTPFDPPEAAIQPEDSQYCTMYWFRDPIEQSLSEWNALAARSFNFGQRPEIGWTQRWLDFWVPIRGYVADHVLVEPDVLPFRPMAGVHIEVLDVSGINTDVTERLHWYDKVGFPSTLGLPGVAGIWTFTSVATFSGNHAAPEPNQTRRLHLTFLDQDPVTVAEQMVALHNSDAWVAPSVHGVDEARRFSGPLRTIVPGAWDWFDGVP